MTMSCHVVTSLFSLVYRGLVNKNGTSLKYDSEALNEVLFSKFVNKNENSTSFRASESYFNEVRFLFTSPQQFRR